VGERVFLSGQIGLVPASLTLPSPPSLAVETALSFQHVKRVIDVLRNNSGGGWLGHNQTNLYWLTNVDDLPHVKRACKEHDNVRLLSMKSHFEIDKQQALVPTLFLLVKGLPKDALVEKQVILHTGRCFVNDDDDEPSPQFRAPLVDRGTYSCSCLPE
jgi:diphthine-ammonia ligase